MEPKNAIDLPSRNIHREYGTKDEFMVRLLHKKHSVVQLVRSQMANFEQKYGQTRKKRSIYARVWHRRYYILRLIMVALLLWFSFMCGVALGATLCENKHYSGTSRLRICWSADTNAHVGI